MRELTSENEVCLALGYFDSVHLGHRKLIETARAYAAEHGLDCAVATFINNAYKVFNRTGKTVYTYAERCDILSDMCDCVLPMRFDAHLKNCPAEKFLDEIFSRYNIKAAVCGYDYSFGAGAKGDSELLKRYCAARGVDCIVVDKIEIGGTRVSTSEIKEMLAVGSIEIANAYLGAPFFLRGKVIHGRGAGRMFDIPTANLKLPIDKLVPKSGVYGSTVVVDGKTYTGATNIGGRPTFELSKLAVETMIKDFSDTIYDKEMTVYLHKYLRPVTRFDTPAELSKQVHADIEWRSK